MASNRLLSLKVTIYLSHSTIGVNNRFGQLSMSPRQSESGSPDNTAHLKGKLSNLNDTILLLQEQLNTHKMEINILRSEKETLESVLTMK